MAERRSSRRSVPATSSPWPACAATTSGQYHVTSANIAAVDCYEPGSVAKVITASAAINEGVVTPDTWFDVPVLPRLRPGHAVGADDPRRRAASGASDVGARHPRPLVEHGHHLRVGEARSAAAVGVHDCVRLRSALGARLPWRVEGHPQELGGLAGHGADHAELRLWRVRAGDPTRRCRQRRCQRRRVRRPRHDSSRPPSVPTARDERGGAGVDSHRAHPGDRGHDEPAHAGCRVRGHRDPAQVDGITIAGKTGTGVKSSTASTARRARTRPTTRRSSASSPPSSPR